MAKPILLTTTEMARFVARGFLRFDALVPDVVNRRFLGEIGRPPEGHDGSLGTAYRKLLGDSALPAIPPGVPLVAAYPEGSPIRELLALPRVDGAIRSLVGADCVFDHHFLHVTFPAAFHRSAGVPHAAQPTHQDSTIDPRRAFDLQIMYFPEEVTAAMGGTRFIPGSHLRIVSEAAVSRYQNIRGQQHVTCPAGTLLFLHHGLWHGGGVNTSDRLRYMLKIRLAPTVRQCRLWNTSDLDDRDRGQRPIFYVKAAPDPDDVHTILTTPEPWFEADTGRLEYLNRIRLWRHLTADPQFDADYWMTRLENEPP